ncbi:MAG: helix-turn-helix domain-containing protein [Planctomycetota bacterium]|nr:helix-turn-helix domain-containing protein [Planctomycetota bacterium]
MAKTKTAKRARKTGIRHEPIVAVFAQRLREHRRRAGLKQRELANKAHLSVSYVTRLERALTAPGIDLVEKLAGALGIAVTDLLASEPADPYPVLKAQAERRLSSILGKQDSVALAALVPILAALDDSIAARR